MQKKGLQVTILSTCPVADYKTQESTLTLASPFLKALKTKEFQDQVCCPLLEQPNIVRDLPAAGTLQFQLFTGLLVATQNSLWGASHCNLNFCLIVGTGWQVSSFKSYFLIVSLLTYCPGKQGQVSKPPTNPFTLCVWDRSSGKFFSIALQSILYSEVFF